MAFVPCITSSKPRLNWLLSFTRAIVQLCFQLCSMSNCMARHIPSCFLTANACRFTSRRYTTELLPGCRKGASMRDETSCAYNSQQVFTHRSVCTHDAECHQWYDVTFQACIKNQTSTSSYHVGRRWHASYTVISQHVLHIIAYVRTTLSATGMARCAISRVHGYLTSTSS